MLKKLRIQIPNGPYGQEITWARMEIKDHPDWAHVLSVVRYGGECCQFKDIVEWRPVDGKSYDGEIVQLVQSSGYCLHRISGPPITVGQGMALAEKMRERQLQIEVWSVTMVMPGRKPEDGNPLSAGVVLSPTDDPLESLLRLRVSAKEVGIEVACPSLSRAAHDEVGALREQRLARKWAA